MSKDDYSVGRGKKQEEVLIDKQMILDNTQTA